MSFASTSGKDLGRSWPDRAILYLVLLIGLLVGAQGICRWIAGAFQLEAQRKFDIIGKRQGTASLQEYMSAADDLETANRWWPDAHNPFVIGISDIRLAQTKSDGQREILLDAGAAQLRESIAMTPANPDAWLWLAYARFLKQGPSPEVLDPLIMSIELGPFDPSVAEMRCQIGLASYALLSTDRKKTVNEQIRILARISLAALMRVAQQTGTSGLVQSILGS